MVGQDPKERTKLLYALTPRGEILAPGVGPYVDEVAAMMEQALEKWEKMGKGERLLSEAPLKTPGASTCSELYPEGGLILQAFSRDGSPEDRKGDWNQDFVWVRKEEVGSMIPASKTRGTRQPVPDAVAFRLARFHLVDNVHGVRGEGMRVPSGFRKEDVRRAELVLELKASEGDLLKFQIEGAVRNDNGARGYDATLLGRATYSEKEERFVSFALVAVGTRWGERPARKGTADPSRIGAAFRLASSDKADRVPPDQIHRGYFDALR